MDLQKYKDDYKKYGFCIIRKFIKRNSLKVIKKFSNEIKKKKPKKNQIMKYYEKSILDKKKEILVRTEYFYDFHSGLRKFLNSYKVHKILTF